MALVSRQSLDTALKAYPNGAAADTGGGASRIHSHAEHGNENRLQTHPVKLEQLLKAFPGKESKHFSEKS
jgi:hypothetical protein